MGVCIVSFFYVLIFVPETAGVKAEEIVNVVSRFGGESAARFGQVSRSISRGWSPRRERGRDLGGSATGNDGAGVAGFAAAGAHGGSSGYGAVAVTAPRDGGIADGLDADVAQAGVRGSSDDGGYEGELFHFSFLMTFTADTLCDTCSRFDSLPLTSHRRLQRARSLRERPLLERTLRQQRRRAGGDTRKVHS